MEPFTSDRMVLTAKEAIRLAINAGVDMMMVPSQFTYNGLLKELVKRVASAWNALTMPCDASCALKHRVGTFEQPNTFAKDYPKFGSEEFAAYSRQAALESIVLLKNDSVDSQSRLLPIKQGTRLLVCGPNANSMRTLNGGWSYTWQGDGADREEFTGHFNTIYEALRNKLGSQSCDIGRRA